MTAIDVRDFWHKKPKENQAVPIKSIALLEELKVKLDIYAYDKINKLLTAYSDIKPEEDLLCKNRLKALKDLDTYIYSWFGRTSVPNLSDVKGAKELIALLSKSQKVHERLVEATKENQNVLPFDTTGLVEEEILERKKVWRGIIDGTAEVKLQGTEKFQKQTRAKLAKMLETKTGFEILKCLSAPKSQNPDPNERVIICDELPEDLSYLKEAGFDGNLSFAKEFVTISDEELNSGVKCLGTEDKSIYPVYPHTDDLEHLMLVCKTQGMKGMIVGDTKYTFSQSKINIDYGPVKEGENTDDYIELTRPEDLREAIFSGKKGVILGKQKYTFKTGSGSRVKTIPPEPDSEDGDTAGVGGTQTITPPFITLAHELGHALNIRSGAITRPNTDMMVALCQLKNKDLTEVQIEEIWTNPEEFFTITNFDNAVRKESGVPLRSSHKPCSALQKMAKLSGYYREIINLGRKDDVVVKMKEYDELARYSEANKRFMEDDKIVNELILKLKRAQKAANDKAIINIKKKDLQEHRMNLEKVYKEKRGQMGKEHPFVNRYEEIQTKLKEQMPQILAVGTPDLTTVKDQMRQLRFDLNDTFPTKN